MTKGDKVAEQKRAAREKRKRRPTVTLASITRIIFNLSLKSSKCSIDFLLLKFNWRLQLDGQRLVELAPRDRSRYWRFRCHVTLWTNIPNSPDGNCDTRGHSSRPGDDDDDGDRVDDEVALSSRQEVPLVENEVESHRWDL
jgi:hypothetical protein